MEYGETYNLGMTGMDGVSAAGQTVVLQYEKDKKSCVLSKRLDVRVHVAYVTSTHPKMGE